MKYISQRSFAVSEHASKYGPDTAHKFGPETKENKFGS